MVKSYRFNLMILGGTMVGKTAIRRRFLGDTLSMTSQTLNDYDVRFKHIKMKGKEIHLEIWVVHESSSTTASDISTRSMGFMLVYDITNERSFEDIAWWRESIKKCDGNDAKFILVGNKCDLEDKRQVSHIRAREFASSHGMSFMEVSTKENLNIEEAFLALVSDVLTNIESKPERRKQTNSFRRLGSRMSKIFAGKTSYVPEEIAEDPYSLALYETALRDGTEIDQSIRINVVGNFGQGKTSLVRRLLNKNIRNVVRTDGIDINRYICYRRTDGKLSFKNFTLDTANIIRRLVSVVSEQTQVIYRREGALHAPEHIPASIEMSAYDRGLQPDLDRKTEIESSSFENVRFAGTGPESPSEDNKPNVVLRSEQTQVIYRSEGALHAPEHIPASIEMSAYDRGLQPDLDRKTEIESSSFENVRSAGTGPESPSEDNKTKVAMLSEKERGIFAKELKKKRSPSSSQEIHTVFNIWDFGGQYVYYATHTLFHSKRAIYLLVVDLSKGLDEVVDDKEFPGESSEECMEYFLHFWMNSIHSFVGSEDGSKPMVIIVGTHKDKVEGNAEAKRQYIENYFNKIRTAFEDTRLLNHFHMVDFAVDNTDTNDEDIGALRDTIITVGNEQSRPVEIPAKWIHLEKVLIERKHEKIVPLEFVLGIDAANEVPIGDTEQIKLFLRYHHSKGTFVYFEEEPISRNVVLDPQYLVDAFKCIITSERFCTHDPAIIPLWKLLMKYAKLEQGLIDRQWGKDADQRFMKYKDILLAFLTRHHIISEATHFNDTTHQSEGLGWFVVPSLLKSQIQQTQLRQFLNGKKQTSLRFVMLFDNSAIVPTIYHRLMAAQIGKWSITQFKSRNLISKDQCTVRLNIHHVGITQMRHDMIELTVVNLCPSSDVSGDQADSLRRFSEAVVSHEFSKLYRNKEDRYKPYTIQYRCNHQSHDVTGSINVISADTLNEQSLVPCPDLMSHDIQVTKSKSEWTKDTKERLLVINPKLSNQVLGRVSCCIGKNWQLLGLELRVSEVQIQRITMDHPNSVAMQIYDMLITWFRKMKDSADMNVLVQKMQECADVTIDWDEIRNIVDDLK